MKKLIISIIIILSLLEYGCAKKSITEGCVIDSDCTYGYSCRSKVGGGNECRVKSISDIVEESNNLILIDANKKEIIKEEKTKNWTKLIEGSDLKYDANKVDGTLTLKIDESYDGMEFVGTDKWNNIIKKYVETLPVTKRDAILRILINSHTVQYDYLENQLIFGLRNMDGANGYVERGEIQLNGVIKNKKVSTEFKFVFNNTAYNLSNMRINLNRIKIYTDKSQFDLNVQLGKDSWYAEWGRLPLNNSENVQIIKLLANSSKSVIRFYGADSYYDFVLVEKSKKLLKTAIKAIEEINTQSTKK